MWSRYLSSFVPFSFVCNRCGVLKSQYNTNGLKCHCFLLGWLSWYYYWLETTWTKHISCTL